MRAVEGNSGEYILAQLDKLDMNSSGEWLRDLLVAFLFETIMDQQVRVAVKSEAEKKPVACSVLCTAS